MQPELVVRAREAVLAAGLAAFAAAAQEPATRPATSAVRPTLVRVVGADGRPLGGARVVFAAAPFAGCDRPDLSRVVEFRADARGRARARIEPGPIWCAWAVWDGPEQRLASPVATHVTPGRPLRLTARPFEAFRVRWVGSGPWRQKVGALSTRFIVHPGFLRDAAPRRPNLLGIAARARPGSLDGFVCASFARPIPASRNEVVRLPPLPLHPYYAVLADAAGGFLDVRYMNPAFHSPAANPRVQHLYERSHFLKQLALGMPVTLHATLRDEEGAPVGGADVLLRPNRANCEAERCYRTGADGRVDLVVSFREAKTFGTWQARLYAWAPGHVAIHHYRPQPTTPDGTAFDLRVPRGRRLSWKLLALRPADRHPGRVLLRTDLVDQRRERIGLPIRIEAGGRLRLPAPPPASAGGSRLFDLFLVRDGMPIPLRLARGRPAKDVLAIDLGQVVTVDVRATARAGPRPHGGVLQVFASRDQAVPVLRRHLDADGACRLALLPGRYFVTLRSPRSGDGFAELVVAAGKPARLRVDLAPYRVLNGSVVAPKGAQRTPSLVSLQCIPARAAPAALRHLVESGNRSVLTDAGGHFEAFATSRAAEIALTTTLRVGNVTLTARGRVRSAAPGAIDLVPGNKRIRTW